MVRDRLTELKKRAEESEGLGNKDILVEVEDISLQNVFEIAKEISEGIEEISGNIDLCKCYMKQMFESPFREKDLSSKLTDVFQSNGQLTQTINSNLRRLENHVKTANKTCTVGRIEMIQYSTLRTRFRECISKNNEEMECFRNFRITTYKAQLKAKGVDVEGQELSELLNADQQLQIFTDNLLIETAEGKRLLCEAEELNEQLLKIENLIMEIKDLFFQMSVLVEEQQELIDVVEYQTQQAVEFVSKTPRILRETEKKKWKAAKMKFCCFGIITIVLVIATLFFIYDIILLGIYFQ